MTISMYAASVPVFRQMLTSMNDILGKAEMQATERKIDPNALLQARLFPDMFPLTRQVQIAADFAKGASARLAGLEVPSYEDNEQTFCRPARAHCQDARFHRWHRAGADRWQ